MKVVLLVTTPKGQAAGVETKLRKFILAFNNKPVKTEYTDYGFDWHLDDIDSRRYMRLCRNVAAFREMTSSIINNSLTNKAMGLTIGKEEAEELKRMFNEGTNIELKVLSYEGANIH